MASIYYTFAVWERELGVFLSPDLLLACFKGNSSFVRWPTFVTCWILDLTWRRFEGGEMRLSSFLFSFWFQKMRCLEDRSPQSDFMRGPSTLPALWNLYLKKNLKPWKKCGDRLDFVEEVKVVASFFSVITMLISWKSNVWKISTAGNILNICNYASYKEMKRVFPGPKSLWGILHRNEVLNMHACTLFGGAKK